MLERESAGEDHGGGMAEPERTDGRTEGRPSWRLLLIGLSRFPWLTRPICREDLMRGEQSSGVGLARPVGGGGWKSQREAGHTPVAAALLCQSGGCQLSLPDRSTMGNAEKTKKKSFLKQTT